ncbi:hypothetical protein K1T71_007185 [Dendrolimus kikuchii]|uniref:Uncharacterized protein n=1 Tax=Dendrolimus kikuchii TaxID=765133 RepID=A0ACC1D000_9NEOP|nr:hypothetical protein K1T71_007185 [Dendrolimus kikuchii]
MEFKEAFVTRMKDEMGAMNEMSHKTVDECWQSSILDSAIWGYLADTRGRQSVLLVSLLSAATVNVFASLSVNWLMMIALQFVVAFLSPGLYSMTKTILSESEPMLKKNLLILFVTTSCFDNFVYVIIVLVLAIPTILQSFSYYLPALDVYWNSWRTVVVVYSIPRVSTALWVYFVHESPKFVFARGDEKRALEILTRIHRINNLRSSEKFEVQGLVAESSEYKSRVSNSLKDQVVPLFQNPLLKNTSIAIALLVFQQRRAFSEWLPIIMNQFIGIIETGEAANFTLCGIIRAHLDASPDIVNRTGGRNMGIAATGICGLSGILVNLAPNAYASAALFTLQSMGTIVVRLYTAIIARTTECHSGLFLHTSLFTGKITVIYTDRRMDRQIKEKRRLHKGSVLAKITTVL